LMSLHGSYLFQPAVDYGLEDARSWQNQSSNLMPECGLGQGL